MKGVEITTLHSCLKSGGQGSPCSGGERVRKAPSPLTQAHTFLGWRRVFNLQAIIQKEKLPSLHRP